MNIKPKEVTNTKTPIEKPKLKEKYLAIGVGKKGGVWVGFGASPESANQKLADNVYSDTLIVTKTFELSLQ